MPVKGMPVADPVPFWWFHGELEVGGRAFLNNPNRNGVNSAGQDSLAKFYEYRDLRPGPFGNFHLATGTSNGLYQVDVWGKNVGYDDQRYDLTASKAGQHYFNFQWDQTPHLYSTSAQSIYNGVGTNALTLVPGLATGQLWGAPGNTGASPIPPAGAVSVRNLINANVHQTDIGIRRDTAAVEYRYTPTANWDIKADYSNTHRTGSQVDGVTFGWGTSAVRVDAPRPVNDTTENYGLNGEYAGTSPWGKNFNFKLAYNGSTYTDSNSSYTIQNPFCNAAGTLCDRTGTTADDRAAPIARMSLWPSNNVNGFTGTLGADLPARSRYMGTVSYTMMRQNEAFLPFTITPGLLVNGLAANSTASLPASSLNGAINTLLLNNVLTTQITSDLKSKLSYRYYNHDNNTPELFFPGPANTRAFVGADTVLVSNYPSPRSLQASYTRQNAGADLNWHATRQLNLGVGYGLERYDRTRADVSVTNEHSGKFYGDWKPTSWVTARASYTHSARRFSGNYDEFNNVLAVKWVSPTGGLLENPAWRNYMYADRDRDQAKFSLAVDVMPKVTVTPTAGLKYDNYLNNINLGSITTTCAGASCLFNGTYNNYPLIGTQPGLKTDNSWNWGAELSIVASPVTTFMFSYTREYGDKQLYDCSNSAASGTTGPGGCQNWSATTGAPSAQSTRIQDTVDTFIFRMKHEAIANKLDFDLGYTLSLANNSTSTNPNPFNAQTAGVVTQSGGPFPDVKTTFQRFDILGTYKFDKELVQRSGFKGELIARLRYAYESNRVTNWQNDMMQTYMYSNSGALTNTNLGYMTWLAGNNPNYDVQLISASLAWRW